jgi:hypothetical protein
MPKHSKWIPIFFLLAGVLLFSFFPKTPNWFWMAQYSAPDFSLLGTGLPIFRPLIPFETIEWKIHQSNWLSDNFLYGLLSGFSLYLLFINCRSQWSIFFITTGPLMIAIWYASHGGPIYDITAIFGIIAAATIIQTLGPKPSIKRLVLLGIFLSITDLSRPFGLTLCILMIGYLFIKNRNAVFIPLITLVFLAGPFHINQLARFQTITLSTYGGNNLMEAFSKVITPEKDCYRYEELKQLDSLQAAKCAANNQKKVAKELLKKPQLIFTAINPERIIQTIFPQPIWHASNLEINSKTHIGMRYIFHALLVMLYGLAFWAMIKPQQRIYKSLLLLCFSYIVFTILIASWLSEVIRTYLPALALITLLAQTQFKPPPDEGQTKALAV